MKMVCVSDQIDAGWLTTRMQKGNITIGKTYDVMLFSNASGQYTSTNAEFLVYDDAGAWTMYPLENFKPRSE